MGIARFVKVFSVFAMSVLVRCANVDMSTRLRPPMIMMSVFKMSKIVVGRVMNVVVFLGMVVIMLTAVVVRGFFVRLVAVRNAGAFILLVSASHGALDRCGSFDAVFCKPLSVKLQKKLQDHSPSHLSSSLHCSMAPSSASGSNAAQLV